MTIDLSPNPLPHVMSSLPAPNPNQTISHDYTSLPRQKKIETVKRSTKWKIKSINNFAIYSKFHLKNPGLFFQNYLFDLFFQIKCYHSFDTHKWVWICNIKQLNNSKVYVFFFFNCPFFRTILLSETLCSSYCW